MKNYNDRLSLGYFGHDGKLHKVERLDKIPEIKGVISDEVQERFIPEYHEPPEFSMKVEVGPEFAKDLKAAMRKLDELILDGYDNVAKSVECCLGGNYRIKNCTECGFYREDGCAEKLMQSVLSIIKNQRELVAKAIEEKWKDE